MHPIRAFAAFAILGGLAAAASAGTVNVPADAATIQQGCDLALDGDTVVVAAGNYSGFVLLDQRNNLTIQASGVVTVTTPRGKGVPAAFGMSSCQNITLDGFTISKAAGDGINISTCLNVTIRNCTVDKAKGIGIRAYGGQDITVADCTVSKNGNKKHGISFSSEPGPLTTRGSVLRTSVTNAGATGIIVHGPQALIEDCNVTKSKKAGIELDRAGGTTNGVVRRCTVTKPGDAGIVASGMIPIIEFNTVNSAKTYGIVVVQDANGETASAVIDDNVVTRTIKKDGILATVGANVDRNTVTLAKGDGIRVVDTGVEVRDNTITKSGKVGLHLLGSGHDVTGNDASKNKKADLWDESTGTTFTDNTFVKVKP
jgi:parallel beta-helix repeat protein